MTSAPRRTLCLVCHAVLTDEDGEHYLYLCHPCALDEHDLHHATSRDPDHPDRARLLSGPVVLPTRETPAGRG